MVHDLQLEHKKMKENRIVLRETATLISSQDNRGTKTRDQPHLRSQKTVQWMLQRPTQTPNDRIEYSKEQEMTPKVRPGRSIQDLRHSREASSIITSCCDLCRPGSSMVAAQRNN